MANTDTDNDTAEESTAEDAGVRDTSMERGLDPRSSANLRDQERRELDGDSD